MELTQLNLSVMILMRGLIVGLNYKFVIQESFFLLTRGSRYGNSYTMSTCGLPDMYNLNPRTSSVHIRQTTCGHGITMTYYKL